MDGLGSGTVTESRLLYYAAVILGLALGIAVCRFFWRYLVIGFSRLLERDLRDLLLSHLLKLDRFFYQRHTIGEIMALSTNDLAAVQLACGMGLIAFVDAGVMICAALGFMLYIHPMLTLIAIAPLPILAVLTKLLSARLHKRFRVVQEQFEKLTEFARNSITTIRLLKAYTQEERQIDQFGRLGETYIRHNLKLATVQGVLFPVSALVANCALLLVLYFGGRLTIKGTITVGDFVAFISYLFMLTWPMMAIGWVTNLFQRGATSLERVLQILKAEPTLQDCVVESTRPIAGERFSLVHLTFQYPGHAAFRLDDLSVRIGPGLTGIVGKTGSGKTTLCNILARLYPVNDNTVFLDNEDVNRLPLATVRAMIAYVPQESIIFSESISANIVLGRPEANKADIEKVAKAVGIHDEILAFPQGYATRVGERGILLSGGQRQRLAMARALLLNRPILIIDDGLSAVDLETEHMIIGSVASYLKGKTCIIVSHRVAPLADADQILVMDQGCIVAQGDHQSLLDSNSFYSAIYRQQISLTKKGQ